MAISFKQNYSASVTYSIDNVVRYTNNGKTYISLANSNTGHTPGATGSESYWKELVGVKYNSDNPDWLETDTSKSSYILNKPFIYNGNIIYNDNASNLEEFCENNAANDGNINADTIIIDGVAYKGDIAYTADSYHGGHSIKITDSENLKSYCLYWDYWDNELHFTDSLDDGATFDKVISSDSNIIIANNKTEVPLFNSDLANYNIGYLPSYLSNTGKTNEEVSGDITLKLGDTEYTGDNIVYNYDTDSDTYYITLTKNNLDVIRIEYHDTQYSCYISYYDDTGTLDHTDSAQDPSSYPLYMHLNREVYNINPLYNTFFDSLGGGNNIDVDYTIEDNQMIIAMTCGENSANVTIPIVDNVAY